MAPDKPPTDDLFGHVLPISRVIAGANLRPDGTVLPRTITCPMLRPDGTVLQTPGLDPQTGLLYKPDVNYPRVEDTLSRGDRLAHRNVLVELAAHWPFLKPHHRSAWLAGLFTCIARPFIDGPCPLFVVDSDSAGTGKTLLVHVTSRLAFGQDAVVLSQPDDDHEMRKRITTLLSRGDPLVLIDNVARPLGSPSLDAVLTSTQWSDRVLGTSRPITLPNKATWWATGINLALGPDTVRRTLRIQLSSSAIEPARTFARHHFAHSTNWLARPRQLTSALSLIRNYIVEGGHKVRRHDAPWHSFESWMAFIPGLFHWLDMPDPLRARGDA
jgi:hypothetical protein